MKRSTLTKIILFHSVIKPKTAQESKIKYLIHVFPLSIYRKNKVALKGKKAVRGYKANLKSVHSNAWSLLNDFILNKRNTEIDISDHNTQGK